MRYEDFVAKKLAMVPPTGLSVVPDLHPSLFPHQRDLVTWALKRGRAALFADTGLGKTAMQLEWARHVASEDGGRVLVLAPLAVAAQTAREGERLGIPVTICRDGSDVTYGVNVTNYDRLHRFDPSIFRGVVLDESSIIKHHDAKTLRALLDAFAATPFRLCATATPSPNDYTELGTHAEFLGICTRTEMLAEYFCHDGGETQVWRLKGHARSQFWRWIATWAALLRKPSDLGYDDGGYDLPPLRTTQHILPADPETVRAAGLLFAAPASDLTARRYARKASLGARVEQCAALVNADAQPWVVWCDLNAESEALVEAIDGAIEVRGSQTPEEKEQLLRDFCEGRARVLVSKPSICGFGINMQHCARMAFVGVTDSYEAYYQAVRRIWRFGQKRECEVEATRTKALGLMHKQLCKDSTMSRAGLAQYLLAFRKPGANDDPVANPDGLTSFAGLDAPTSGNLSHERWRRYASPIWTDIDFTRTLNERAAREGADERHVCPMALDIIERAVTLWSSTDEIVLDPFTGVGSTGVVALEMGRRFVGAELKGSYYRQAVANLREAETQRQGDLFGGAA